MKFSYKYKITAVIFIIELFFLSIIIYYNHSFINRFAEELIDKDTKTNALLFQEMIKTPLMVYDLATLDNMLSKFVNLPIVSQVELKDTNNNLLSHFSDEIHKSFNNKFHKVINLKLKDNDIELGQVKIVFDLHSTYDKIEENTQKMINIAIIETILSIIIAFLLGTKLSKNLFVMNDALKNISTNNSDMIKIDIRSKDEFHDLAENFNNMQVRLKNEINKNLANEKLLNEQSKNASLGEMIGNIAHQWRQPLSAITTVASAIQLNNRLDTLEKNDIEKNMQIVINKANYLSETINTFRNFLKEDKETKDFVLENLIKKSIEIIGATLKDHHIKLLMNIDYENTTRLIGVESELSQVIINIINNAKDILISKNIETPWIKLDLLKSEKRITITIEDNAGGMDKEVLPKIFDPYFTTKHQSQGTGLGLHMSYRIVTKSFRGNLYAKNTNNGAKFFIELPLQS